VLSAFNLLVQLHWPGAAFSRMKTASFSAIEEMDADLRGQRGTIHGQKPVRTISDPPNGLRIATTRSLSATERWTAPVLGATLLYR